MDLFIQIKNGEPFEHPIPDWNLKMLHPDLDPNNPPEGFARFIRIPYPESTDQTVESIDYILSQSLTDQYRTPTYTDQYNMRDLTLEELALQQANQPPIEQGVSKEFWWINSEVKQDEGKIYFWNQEKNNWVDGSQYIPIFIDFFLKYNIDYKSFNYSTLEGLNDSQKKEFADLITKYSNIVKSK